MLDLGPVPTLTRPLASYAIGVDPRTVRGWVESGALGLLAPRAEAGKWMRLAPVDVVRLAVFGSLLRWGFTMAEAAGIVAGYVDPHLAGLVLAAGNAPWHLVRNALLGLVLAVSREPDGRVAVSAHCMRGSRPVWHQNAMLAVNVYQLVQSVHQRARERDTRHA